MKVSALLGFILFLILFAMTITKIPISYSGPYSWFFMLFPLFILIIALIKLIGS